MLQITIFRKYLIVFSTLLSGKQFLWVSGSIVASTSLSKKLGPFTWLFGVLAEQANIVTIVIWYLWITWLCVFLANKGRASNFGILRVLQQIGSICLAASTTLRTRWVASEANCADGPSRGQITPGPFSPQCSPQASEECKCPSGGATAPSWQEEGGEATEGWKSENKQWSNKPRKCPREC